MKRERKHEKERGWKERERDGKTAIDEKRVVIDGDNLEERESGDREMEKERKREMG